MTVETRLAPAPRASLTQAERLEFSRRKIAQPVALFLLLAVVYPALVLLALAAPTPIGFVLSPLCGVVIGMLFLIGHDACHQAFTASSLLNHIIGRIAFLPSLHAYSVWDRGHNGMHHGYNNVRGEDAVWEPWSPDDYRAHGPVRRLMYRFYRTPIGVGFYYMMELWAPYHAWSVPVIHRNLRPVDFFDTALLLLFIVVQLWVTIIVGGALGHWAVTSLALGFAIPFLVWNGLMSLIIFCHHTHPTVRWYPSIAAWKADQGAINGTAHVRFRQPFSALVLSIMEHNAHHVAPGVPLYNLRRMQAAMASRDTIQSWEFSWQALSRICKRCKLYDYELGRWVTFSQAEQQLQAD